MAHHEAIALTDQSILALTLEDRRIPTFHPRHDVQDNLVTTLSPEGAARGHLSLFATLTAAAFPLKPVAPSSEHGRRRVDLFHANSVAVMTRPELAPRHPLYAPGNLLVSLRHQDAVVVLDPQKRRLVWSWGHGTLSGPHDASVLPDGHLLIFDNGLARGWSRVVELDPVRAEVTWSWRAAPPERFFTAGRGSAQRLANGNTLLCESERGRVLEITGAGEIVWEYWVPHLSAAGHRATLVRARRVDAQRVDPLLSGP
jgi:hypothetical protein